MCSKRIRPTNASPSFCTVDIYSLIFFLVHVCTCGAHVHSTRMKVRGWLSSQLSSSTTCHESQLQSHARWQAPLPTEPHHPPSQKTKTHFSKDDYAPAAHTFVPFIFGISVHFYFSLLWCWRRHSGLSHTGQSPLRRPSGLQFPPSFPFKDWILRPPTCPQLWCAHPPEVTSFFVLLSAACVFASSFENLLQQQAQTWRYDF